jgi:hypothetical protein
LETTQLEDLAKDETSGKKKNQEITTVLKEWELLELN